MPQDSAPWATAPAGAELVGHQRRLGDGMSEDEWAWLFTKIGDGVLAASGTDGAPLEVFATGNDRVLRVRPGRAVVRSKLFTGTREGGNTYTAALTVPTTTEKPSVPWWRVVVRMDPAAKAVTLALRESANADALTQDPYGIWEVPIGTYKAATGAITNDMITDDRRFSGDVLRQYRSLYYPGPVLTAPENLPANTRVTLGGWGYATGDNNRPIDRDTDGIDYTGGIFTVKADGLYEGQLQIAFSGGRGGAREVAYILENGSTLSRCVQQTTATAGTITCLAVMPPRFLAAGTKVQITVLVTADGPVQISSLAGTNLATLRRVGSGRQV